MSIETNQLKELNSLRSLTLNYKPKKKIKYLPT